MQIVWRYARKIYGGSAAHCSVSYYHFLSLLSLQFAIFIAYNFYRRFFRAIFICRNFYYGIRFQIVVKKFQIFITEVSEKARLLLFLPIFKKKAYAKVFFLFCTFTTA